MKIAEVQENWEVLTRWEKLLSVKQAIMEVNRFFGNLGVSRKEAKLLLRSLGFSLKQESFVCGREYINRKDRHVSKLIINIEDDIRNYTVYGRAIKNPKDEKNNHRIAADVSRFRALLSFIVELIRIEDMRRNEKLTEDVEIFKNIGVVRKDANSSLC